MVRKSAKSYDAKNYKEYVEIFLSLCREEGRPLKYKEFCGTNDKYYNVLPNPRWFVKHCPDRTLKNYSEFLEYLGFIPRYYISKNAATKCILKMYKEKGRLYQSDFMNAYRNYDKISTATIARIWGSFNNMLRDLGLPINQEDMLHRHRTTDHLECDIKRLCEHIYSIEGDRPISLQDIDECEWCLNSQSYNKHFTENLNLTIGQYIESLGYKSIKPGYGMYYEFDDGEVTLSKYEYAFTSFLHEHNIKYKRNVNYRDFIPNYTGNKDCDYVLDVSNRNFYVEVAGMLDYSKGRRDILFRYKEHLDEKERMLKENNLWYKIVYPTDFEDLNKVFSFLFKNEDSNSPNSISSAS